VGRAKEVQAAEKARIAGEDVFAALPEVKEIFDTIHTKFDADVRTTQIGSTIFAVKPGDGSAREQAASCQKVLGGFANIANEYATKRYRSNLINWGMLPFLFQGELPFENGDYLFVKDIKKAVQNKEDDIKAYVVNKGMKEFTLHLGNLTEDERDIIEKGCLINYYRSEM
jgi:aconitate hydratase